MPAVHRCKRCNAVVRYVTTQALKSQALDPAPHKDGTVAIVAGLGVTLSKRERDAHDGELWMPHAATCSKGRPSQPAKAVGLTAITGLSFVDEADRVAKNLIRFASDLTKRPNPDERDCEVAFRYFKQHNTVDAKVIPLLRPRVRQIIAARAAGSEVRA